ncbi:hypothetical protein ACTXT7_010980, partial [Hymenolepis weldensis]
MVNLAKWDASSESWVLLNSSYSKFVLPKEFDGLCYFETVQVRVVLNRNVLHLANAVEVGTFLNNVLSRSTGIEQSLGFFLYRHQAKPEICESYRSMSTTRYHFRHNHNFIEAVEIIESSKTGTNLPICNECLLWRDLSGQQQQQHVSDSQLSLPALDWLCQHGLLDPPINAVCNRVHSATSTASFTAEMKVQRFLR